MVTSKIWVLSRTSNLSGSLHYPIRGYSRFVMNHQNRLPRHDDTCARASRPIQTRDALKTPVRNRLLRK